MKFARMFCGLLAFVTTAVMAQPGNAAKSASPTPQAQAAPQAPATIASTIDQQVGIIERELVSAAEAMPEDKYNFTPAALNIPGSDYKTVRSFAQQIKHVAATNYLLWGLIVGEKPPADFNKGEGPAAMTSKADILKYLKDSYALGHRAVNTLSAASSVEMVPNPFGPNKLSKLFCGSFGVAHGFDHYGQIVEYLRMNGIVPPATQSNN